MAYEPLFPPDVNGVEGWDLVQVYLMEELRKLADELKLVELIEYHVEPDKPFHGMRVIADGTDWDPGSGRGVYWYDTGGASWNLLG
jgi:hypothetical protein